MLTLCDVGPRDGLQNDAVTLEPGIRAELCNRLAKAGLPRIEAVSFVHPERVPQMAGAEEVVAAIEPVPDVHWVGLALNERGYDRLLTTGLDEVHYAVAATESFSQRNQGTDVDSAIEAGRRIFARARADGIEPTVGIGVAFGCPFEGAVDPARTIAIAERLVEAGAAEIMLADTIGVGTPSQTKRLVAGVVSLGVPAGVHLHDTRNTAVANAYAALEAGVSVMDASVGGIGGCPFAPRATGNVATEDLLYMLNAEGVRTGVDLGALIDVAGWLEGVLGRQLPGSVHRAGVFPPAPVG